MSLPSVMIIDDNEADRYLLARLIRKSGISDCVFEAGDGGEAMKFLAARAENEKLYPGKFPPLLIFLDINMPRINGFQFLEQFSELRTKGGYESVVLMMFSSSERQAERDQALKYEYVRGFIQKMPIGPNELRAQVEAATGFEF